MNHRCCGARLSLGVDEGLAVVGRDEAVGDRVLVVGLLLRRALGGDAGVVRPDLAGELLVVPVEDVREYRSYGFHRLHAAMRSFDRDPSAPGEYVVEVQSTLVRCRIADLREQVATRAR